MQSLRVTYRTRHCETSRLQAGGQLTSQLCKVSCRPVRSGGKCWELSWASTRLCRAHTGGAATRRLAHDIVLLRYACCLMTAYRDMFKQVPARYTAGSC
ncbi:hypothetical protein JG688_00004980 [Phytophthora aleatoria]|uniref:Uncharacterized protein n=1 Tax=Phytophthora aleatoria TaxID=2496075 RepID=A0A8J5IVU4_9STRA|nr:hypothetical protein JG688_00004980 [Phytophthora aleatoria]